MLKNRNFAEYSGRGYEEFLTGRLIGVIGKVGCCNTNRSKVTSIVFISDKALSTFVLKILPKFQAALSNS